MKILIEPEGGWEPGTWYRGICSMRDGNPRFSVLVYSGFLDKGKPSAYSGVFADNAVPEEPGDIWPINTPMYLEITEKLFGRTL